MHLKKSLRFAALAGVASFALIACSDTEIATPGAGALPPPPPPPTTTPPPPPPPPAAATGFAARATAPESQADCPTGTSFIADVTLPVSAQTTNFCSLTPDGMAATASASTSSPFAARSSSGTVTGTLDIPLSADPILINGTVFIGDPDGDAANVTFAAGQTFVSASQAGIVDLLVVSRGSTLTAVGTSTQPIVFTSAEDFEDDGLPNGTSGTGDWGGLAINGAAPLNECAEGSTATPGTAECEQEGEGGSGVFGGATADDSSGDFQFVRVQHAGFPFTSTNELNGIALQGVGSGTTFENIQVHRGADDGFEWFGGTVNVSNLVVTGANDDSFDWTDGWVGDAQFLLAVQQPGDDNAIEGDNNGDTDPDATPRSNPTISNVTLIGDGASGEGMQLRAGTDASVNNIIITNFDQGFEFDDDSMMGVVPEVNSAFIAGNVENLVDSEAIFDAGTNNVLGSGTSLNGVLPGPVENDLVAVDPTTLGANFTAGTFVGAFGPEDTASDNFTTGWTIDIPGAEPPGCPEGTTLDASDAPVNFPGRTEAFTCALTGTVTEDVTLTAGNLYRLDGTVFIGNDGLATPGSGVPGSEVSLTIEPGVTIFGDGAASVVDLLVIARGSQIFANGAENAPIVITSRADLDNGGEIRPGFTNEVGGLAINGRAPLNECAEGSTATPGTSACQQSGEGGSGAFGGAIVDDNSGVLNFVQIRYAGQIFNSTNELNALALQGVGNGTEIDFVQILNGGDDGVEWFGGTVNASHIVVTGANDDSLDWTDGWTGALQFAIVDQTSSRFIDGDNGIEGDNNGDTDADALPRSRAIVSNVTLIGDGASGEGAQLRAGTDGALINTIITNFDQGIEFNNDSMQGVFPVFNGISLSANGEQTAGNFDELPIANVVNVVEAATATLGAIPGFTSLLAPGATETAVAAANPVTVCEAVFAAIPSGEAETDPAAEPFTALPSPCDALEPAEYIGALEDENDTWFAGWTIGL
ncbi:MAG: hypothetical protein AAGJ29_01960 [Pseudomonadota bacterium]